MRSSDGASRADAARAALVGAVVFVASATLPRGGLASDEPFGDVHLYRSFAERIRAGELPYRDFFVEYPPGALPVFVAPTAAGDYELAFRLLMTVFGAASVGLLALVLGRLGATRPRLWSAVGAAALVPAVFGPVSLNTYDLWPAFLVAVSVWALVRGHAGWSFAALGLATAAKLVPALLLPLLLVHVARRSGRRAVGRPLLCFAAAGAVVTLPFAAIAPGGLGFSLQAQATRGLHADSLGASLLFAADQLGFGDARVAVRPPGSLEAIGPETAPIALAATLLVVAAAALVVWLSTRAAPSPRTLVVAASATVVAPLALGKVLSPQFLVWAVPLVPLVPGALGVAAVALLWAALGTTAVFFLRYVTPFDLDADVWLLVARNLILVALLAVLIAAVRRSSRSSSS